MEPLKNTDPSVLGDWLIMGRLGEGGFGTVYLAEKGAQKAAIKVIKSEFVEEGDARARLATEAEVLSKLSNPYIGKILDSDVNSDLPWIATEFINGPTLDNKVKYEGPLTEIEWFNLAANLFHAIVAANELGVIHKDIKPSNIILGETGNKLIDFGIAHVSGQTKTVVFGDREGSTPFSSPEHFTPRANPKMDVFSAASTLAFAAKGSSVWVGDNDLQLMRSINDDSPDLTGLTENQVTFLLPLFEKNPSDRLAPEAAQKLALDYIQFLLGEGKQPKSSNQLETRKTAFKRKSNKSKGVILWIAALALGITTFVLTKLFWGYYWSVIFLLLPAGVLWITVRTYRSGIGNNGWGKKSLLKSLIILLTSITVPIVLMLAMLFSAITIPFEIRQFFDQFSSQSQESSLPSSNLDLSVKTVISTKTGDLIEEANTFYYQKKYKLSLDSAAEAALLGNAEAKYLAGRSAEALKDTALALEWYQKGSDSNFEKASLAAGKIYLDQKRNAFAEREFQKAISLGSTEAITELASYYLEFDQFEKASALFEKSIKAGDVNAMVEYGYYLKESGKTKQALQYFLTASKAKQSEGSLLAGYIYSQDEKTQGLAKDFYRLSIKQGLIEANFFLGEILKKEGAYRAAEQAYLLSVNSDSGYSAISLSTLYGENLKDLKSACFWAKEVLKMPDVEKSEISKASDAISLYCDSKQAKTLSPTAKPVASPTPTSSSKLSSKPTSSPNPLASSDKFTVSAPLAQNVIRGSIFGRAFKDGLNFWHVTLTNTKGEKVPAINSIQFRMIGYENAGWMDVPYKLKTESTFGTVYAEVDDILFALIFKDTKYCPEFRAVREEGGKIVQIWEKGLPECSSDYNG